MVDPGEETVVVGVRPDSPENRKNIYYSNLNVGLGGLAKLFKDTVKHIKSVGPKYQTSP